jgi:hypothetical protein
VAQFSFRARSAGGALTNTATVSVGVCPETVYESDNYSATAPLMVQGQAYTRSGVPLPNGESRRSGGGVEDQGNAAYHQNRAFMLSSVDVYAVTMTFVFAGLPVEPSCSYADPHLARLHVAVRPMVPSAHAKCAVKYSRAANLICTAGHVFEILQDGVSMGKGNWSNVSVPV